MVNGFEVPKPESVAPKAGTEYFVPSFTELNYSCILEWIDDYTDYLLLSRGLVHLNEDSGSKHGKSLLGINPKD